ncbi:MAG: type IV pilus modification PilV family protein [Longimicrobiales bacterium]
MKRDGFTLIEVMISLMLLAVSVLGIQLLAANMLRRMATSNLQLTAVQLAEDRIDRIRLEPNYPQIDTFARTEATLAGFPGYQRITTVIREVDTTATGIIDFRRVTVRVQGTALASTVFRTLVIGAP